MDGRYNHQVEVSGNAPDKEVISRVLGGEKELFALIIRRHNQRLYRVGMAILNNDTDVEEAMQISYINAWEHLNNFKFMSSFATWLTRIMVNECLRVKRRKKFVEMKEETINGYGEKNTQPNAFSRLINEELKVALERAINELPEKYRTVFILRELENMSIAETRECLAISEVNVKVRLNRAKSMLRDSLGAVYRSAGVFEFHLSRCDKMVEKVMAEILCSRS